MRSDELGRSTPLEVLRALRARRKSQYADRVYAALPWMTLFSALGVSGVTVESLAGPEPE